MKYKVFYTRDVPNKPWYVAWFNDEGQLHREDGPAAEYSDGKRFWFLNGNILDEKEFIKRMNWINAFKNVSWS